MRIFFLLFMLLSILPQVSFSASFQFSKIENGRNQKVATKVLQHVYQKLGHSITTIPSPAKRAEFLASTGRTDGEVMRVWDYGKNNANLIRVPTPYYTLKTMVFTKKGSDIKIRSVADLKNFQLAKVRGIKHTDVITRDLQGVYEFETIVQMMKFINIGRADAALTSYNGGHGALKQMNLSTIESHSTPLAVRYLYHYIHKKHAYLVPVIDQEFKRMQVSGELQRLFQKINQQMDTENASPQ